MNTASQDRFAGIGSAFDLAVQCLFREGTESISRDLPMGELALSSLDIAQRAEALCGKASQWPVPATTATDPQRFGSELPIGELALSSLDIASRARRFGLAGVTGR